MSDQSVHVGKAGFASALARWPRSHYRGLRTRRERILAALLGGFAFCAVCLALGPHISGGRFGLIAVDGDSMCDRFPCGSCVLVAPLPARNGDFVVAWAEDYHSRDNPDRGPALVVKELEHGRLVSTSSGGHLDVFSIRARVLCCVPTQRLFPWRADDSAAKAVWKWTPALRQRYLESLAEEQRLLSAKMRRIERHARKAQPLRVELHGYKRDPRGGFVYAGVAEGSVTFTLARRPVEVTAAEFRTASVTATTTLRLGGKDYPLTATPDMPTLLEFDPPVRCTEASVVRMPFRRTTCNMASNFGSVEFWVKK